MAEYIDGGSGRIGNIFNSMQRGIQGSILKSASTGTYYPSMMQSQQPLMNGWLKKHGGIVRSWQKKWFSLKEKTLYIFASEDESKSPVSNIYLPGYRILELPHTTEQEKFLFDIVPADSPRVGTSTFYCDDGAGSSNNKNVSSSSSETHHLWATSADDRKAWLKALRRAIFAEEGGGIFGQSLEETMLYDKGGLHRKVPSFVEKCVDFLITNGLEIEGIFRLPGRTSLIRSLREAFDSGETPNFDASEVDVHTIASLLKLYLRELPSPLIPFKAYEPTIKLVTRDMNVDPDQALEDLVKLVQSFPQVYYNMLQYLCRFLQELTRHEEVNKMTAMNLATCFVHSFIRPDDDDPALLMGTSNGRTQVTFILITHCDQVFSMEYTSQGSTVNIDALVDVDGKVSDQPTFDPNAMARHSQAQDLIADDLFSLDDKRQSVQNLPQPINPDPSCQFSNEIKKGLSRTGSKRGAVIVSDEYNDVSERDSSTYSDDDLPTPLSDHFACLTPTALKDDTRHSIQSSAKIVPNLPPRPLTIATPPSVLRPKVTQASSLDSAVSSLPSAASPSMPSIPPRPQSVQIPSIPPRPTRVKKSISLCIESNGVKQIDDRINIQEDPAEEPPQNECDSLIEVDTSTFTVEQFQEHVSNLVEAIKKQTEDIKELKEENIQVRNTHKKTTLEMAEQLDSEKVNLMRSIDKIMELQMKITSYEMRYGPVD